jgi:hypothetical protein
MGIRHPQVTDAYLLSLAGARSGVLATLDRKLDALAASGAIARRHLRVVGA